MLEKRMVSQINFRNSLTRMAAANTTVLFLLVIVAFSFVLRLLWLDIPIHPDEGEAGYNAMLWLRGSLPYVTRGMDKPPLLYFLYLLCIRVFGNNIFSIRLLNDLLFVASIVPLCLVASDWFGKKVGLLSALFYGAFMSAPATEGPYAMAASLSIPFLIFSVYFAHKSSNVETSWPLFFSGIFASFVSLIYQQWAAFLILLLVIVLINGRTLQEQERKNLGFFFGKIFRNLFILMLGVVIPLTIFSLYFFTQGGFNDMMRDTVTNLLGQDLQFVQSQLFNLDYVLLTFLETLPLLIFAACGVLVALFKFERKNAYLLTWFAVGLGLWIILPKQFGHYTLFLVPVCSILSGIGVYSIFSGVKLGSNSRMSRKILAVFLSTVFVFSLFVSIYFQSKQYPNFSIYWKSNGIELDWPGESEGNLSIQLSIVDYLTSLDVTDGEVLLHGWFPHLYWLSGLEAPSPYLCTYTSWSPIPQQELQRLVNGIEQHSFKYILLCNNSLPDAIRNTTIAKYQWIKSIGNVQIFGAETLRG